MTVLLALLLFAGERTYELRGRIEPPPRLSVVSLSGAYTPFMAETIARWDGKFKFKKLPAGTYVLAIGARGQGSMRQTIEIGPGTADKKGRVELVVHFPPEQPRTPGSRRLAVDVKDLAIAPQAREEYRKAFEALGRRDVEGARKRLKRAIEIAPQYADAWNLLGTIAYQGGRYQEAEGHFREALKQHPDAYTPLVNLGGVLINLGRCQEAIEINQRAVKERPRDALANSQLGMAYYCMGRDAEAAPFLETAKQIDPALFSNPQLVLAEIYARRGQPARAAAELEGFLRLHPDAPNAAQLRETIAKLKRASAPR